MKALILKALETQQYQELKFLFYSIKNLLYSFYLLLSFHLFLNFYLFLFDLVCRLKCSFVVAFLQEMKIKKTFNGQTIK